MEVLNNLKGLLHTKSLLLAERSSDCALNVDAGAELLAHFQNQWHDMHALNDENAARASEMADEIATLHAHIAKENESAAAINQMLASNLNDRIKNCAAQITRLHGAFGQTEEALLDLEDLIERCELMQKKRAHRYQFALYQEKKLENLELARSSLATKHTQTVINHELKQTRALQERQQVFHEAFKKDLETYKTLGAIPKMDIKPPPSALLEEIQLDMDDKELNDFLEN